jgi:pyrimidine-nucleoside phosphorylase
MRALDILRKKRDGLALDRAEIETFVSGVTIGDWPDYQAAALLMAILLRGMTAAETADLTRAMVFSGQTLDLSGLAGRKVDKHSTGGVGDKTSLIVAPLAAACGVVVPMMSGRGLGHTGGTLDKLAAIPGFRVHLQTDELLTTLAAVGCVMIGQTETVAPADRRLYALRDVTATVESIPLITASIMSKKIAEGIDGLILDVKCGRGAFMKTRTDAAALARSLVRTGHDNGVRCRALLTAMDAPLGRAVGNALEVREALDTLRGQGPADVEDLSVRLSAHMVHLAGAATMADAERRVGQALADGRGLEKLRQIIGRQGGDPHVVDEPARLPAAPHQSLLRAKHSGFVTDIDAEQVGRAAMLLGAGRTRLEGVIDPTVGIVVKARPGERVREGEALAELHYRETGSLQQALALARSAWTIADEQPVAQALILDTVED